MKSYNRVSRWSGWEEYVLKVDKWSAIASRNSPWEMSQMADVYKITRDNYIMCLASSMTTSTHFSRERSLNSLSQQSYHFCDEQWIIHSSNRVLFPVFWWVFFFASVYCGSQVQHFVNVVWTQFLSLCSTCKINTAATHPIQPHS